MKRIHRLALCAAGLLLAAVPASAGWSPLGSPIRPLVELQLDPARPELLYALVFFTDQIDAYLWRSEDTGATWRNVQAGLQRPIRTLAIDPTDPQLIWAWTSDGQLWRSADAGDTWSRRFATPADGSPPDVIQLLVDPHHPDTLYRVDDDDSRTRVAVSRDGGASFTQGAPVSGSFSFVQIYVDPKRGELVAFDREGLEVSTDAGQTWSLRGRYRGAGFVGGRFAPSSPDVLYGLTLDLTQCLARSDDAGAHWRRLAYPRLPSAQSSCYDVAVDPRDARHVWVAAQVSQADGIRDLLFESRDGGASWSHPFSMPTTGVVAAGGEVLYTGSVEGDGLYVSQDGGRTWTSRDRGLTAGDLRAGLVAQRLPGGGAGRRLLALDTPSGGSPDALYRSDGGQSWVAASVQPSTIADAGGSTVVGVDGHGVIRSQDGGTTWTAVPAAPAGVMAFRSNLTQPRSMALQAFEDNGAYGNIPLWTSDDGGATWRRSSNGLPSLCTHVASVDWCPDFPAYAVDPFNPSRRWVASVDAFPEQPRIFRSEDAGASWMQTTADLPRAPALAADPQVEDRILAGTDGGLFVSEDGGLHWLPLGDLPAGAAVHQLARDERSATWYAATTDRGIYRSRDGGAHWTLLAGAPDRDSPTIAVDPRRPTALLAAFRGQGAWRWVP